jgi:hypothetical protein
MWGLSRLDAIEEVTEGLLLFYGEASAVDCLMFALSAEVKKVWSLRATNLEFQAKLQKPKI